MFKIKKIISVLLLLFFLFQAPPVLGQENKQELTIYFFWSQGCPHCASAKTFLSEMEQKYPQITVKDYEFSKNIGLIKEFYQNYEVSSREQGFVPAIFTRDKYFVGFSEQIGKEIENYVQEYSGEITTPASQKVKIPFLGEIDTENFSIPFLTVVLGTLDGFNICSLGALVLILGLVLALKSKRKILIFGGVFLLTTVAAYGTLVFLWHRLFVVIAPHIRRMEIVIGILALAGAVYFLKEFLKSRKSEAVCQFGGISKKLAGKIQRVFEKKSSIIVLIGAVLLFAVIVTIIEFPCTAFFPVLFVSILAKAEISIYSSLFYIGLYIFFYMLDELIILLVAVFTFKIWIASPKFITILNLFVSVLLFLLGFYYFFGLLS